VTLVYFDASALVKLVVEEEGSDVAAALWDGCDAALSSRLAHPEVCAALAAAARNHDLAPGELAAVLDAWHEHWASMRPVELTSEVADSAASLAVDQGLRGADAVHLASALVLTDVDVVVAAWDRRLHAAAVAVGLSVAPATLPASTDAG